MPGKVPCGLVFFIFHMGKDVINRMDSEKKEGLSVCLLASGSRGNAVYVSNGSSAVLIDAGLSGIELQRRMTERNIDPESLDAIIVSHEHTDHIAAVGVLSRRFKLPVYITPGTLAASEKKLGKLDRIVHFDCGGSFKVNSLTLHPFSISHDAQDPSGLTILHKDTKVGIATDLGVATSLVKTHLSGCHLVVLEANHDPQMLMQGDYPWPLKQRIKGRTGHLSNNDSRNLVTDIMHDDLSHIVLAHLSEENNTPEKAMTTVGQAVNNTRTRLTLAVQEKSTPVIHVKN